MIVELYRSPTHGSPTPAGGTLVYGGTLDLKPSRAVTGPEGSAEAAEAEIVTLAARELDLRGPRRRLRLPLAYGDILTFHHRGLRSLLVTPQGYRRLAEPVSGGAAIARGLASTGPVRRQASARLSTDLCGFTVVFTLERGEVRDTAVLVEPTPAAPRRADEAEGVTDARIEGAMRRGEEAFWAAVAAEFPEATSGDLDPGTDAGLKETMRRAIQTWTTYNVAPPDGGDAANADA